MATKQTSQERKQNKAKLKADASLERTRENVAEFTDAMSAAKLIRHAFRVFIKVAVGGRTLVGRMQKALLLVLKSDTVSDRGARLVTKGDLGLLKKFEFNDKAFLANILFAKYSATVDRSTGKLTVQFPAFIPSVSITAPVSTTHFRLVTAAAELNLEGKDFTASEFKSEYLPFNKTETVPVNLEVSITPNSRQAFLQVLGVEFYQEVNGKMYLLKSDAHNALSVIHAESAVA